MHGFTKTFEKQEICPGRGSDYHLDSDHHVEVALAVLFYYIFDIIWFSCLGFDRFIWSIMMYLTKLPVEISV